MITLLHNISAQMRRRALRIAMLAVRGVNGAMRGNAIAASRGFDYRGVIGSGSC